MAGETDNLARSMMTGTQSNKFQTSNDADGQIDAALTAVKTVLVDDTNAANVSALDFRRNVSFHLDDGSPVPTSAITITIPVVVRGVFTVYNGCAYPATITIAAQPLTAPIVGPGKMVFLCCDGVNVYASSPDSVNSVFLPAFFMPGLMTNNQRIFYHKAVVAFSLPTNLSGHGIEAKFAATASTIVDVQKNGVSIGTITWAISGTIPTVAVTATSFAVGDDFELIGPATADATLADVAFGIVGTRL